MNRHRILVAVQGLVVTALLLVVYLTLLRPESHEPLFGVGTPPGPPAIVHHQGQHGHRGQPSQGRHPHPHGAGAPTAAPGLAPPVAGNLVPAGGAVPAQGSSAAESPTEQQYADTVSLIFGRL